MGGRFSDVRSRVRGRSVVRRRHTEGSNDSAWAVPDDRLRELVERYGDNFTLPSLSYGTVRDLADSNANLDGLVEASFDMKNLQALLDAEGDPRNRRARSPACSRSGPASPRGRRVVAARL